MHPELARRMERAPLHKFAGLEKQITELISAGRDVIRLDIGSPDQPPAPHILDALTQSANTPSHHGYPGYFGTPALRQSIVDYYARRFNVTLDVKTEVLPLIGSKEGIYNLAFAYLDAGDVALCPNLGYPTYMAGTLLAGAEVYALEMRPDHDWTPDLDSIPADVLQRAKILWLNYPNNPTGATVSIEFFARAIDFARRHHLLLAHDNPYSEITFDGYVAPSLLQVPGAKEVAVEFNSFSKAYNMGGWRLGMVVGNVQAVGALSRLKTNVDSGIFRAIQDAGVAALTGDQEWLSERNALYAVRRDIVVDGLRQAGFAVDRPRATIYVWARIPDTGLTSEQFSAQLLDEALVSIAPGSIFGGQGEHYVRISLGQAPSALKKPCSVLCIGTHRLEPHVVTSFRRITMVTLYDAETNVRVGRIAEKQLAALIGWMEEEDSEDREYYLTAEDCDLMEEQGVDPTLVAALRSALRGRDDMDLRYEVEAESA